jgi:hypothetical protein
MFGAWEAFSAEFAETKVIKRTKRHLARTLVGKSPGPGSRRKILTGTIFM